jgi:hypothetical protein
MREVIRAKPDLTLRELKAELGTDLSVQTLCTALKRLHLTVKKGAHRRGAGATGRRGEAGGAEAGAATAESRSARVHRRPLVKTNMTWPHGRAPKGERLLASVPHGHWKTTIFLAALRTTGLTAPLVVDGAINGEIFLS